MTKVDIFSGFLGAGKTTLIKKLIGGGYPGEKLMLIENEFGEIGIDGGFMAEAGIEITEMNSGCICCSLVGDFGEALRKAVAEYSPDRILIEPSGVGKLSDVVKAVLGSGADGLTLSSASAVVDAVRCRMYAKNFGEFFLDQVEHASCIILSRTGGMDEGRLLAAVELLRSHNDSAPIVTTPWEELDCAALRQAMEGRGIRDELEALMTDSACPVCGGHHHEHHHHHDHDCGCHEHHHDHDHECGCHEHHHEHECDCHEHHHGHDHECGCHEHHHDHDHDCGCHEHHHEHHHGHHAGDVFDSWGVETAREFSEDSLRAALSSMDGCGQVLRAKGIVRSGQGWLHFDYVPGDAEIRCGAAAVTGRLCVIGSGLDRQKLKELFGV